jgi:hypothetical protein
MVKAHVSDRLTDTKKCITEKSLHFLNLIASLPSLRSGANVV